jgi:hypothetical protein
MQLNIIVEIINISLIDLFKIKYILKLKNIS